MYAKYYFNTETLVMASFIVYSLQMLLTVTLLSSLCIQHLPQEKLQIILVQLQNHTLVLGLNKQYGIGWEEIKLDEVEMLRVVGCIVFDD